MKNVLFFCIVFLGILHSQFDASGANRTEGSRDSTVFGFFSGIQGQRQEKVWLHLDKPYYAAGDTVWFRAYLTDAVVHTPDTLSNFIYVDLFDRKNKLVSAKKIKRDSLGFANNLLLPDSLSAGEYTLRAYTGWMLNFDPDNFYQHNFSIGRSTSDIQTDVTYTDTDMMVIRFSDKSGSPLPGNDASFALFDKNGQALSSGELPTSPTGALFVALPADSVAKGGYVETRMKLRNGAVYKRTFFLEPSSLTFDIQFLPEGGDLVPGVLQSVAFRAVRSDGYPAQVQGAVLNRGGDTVARFSSTHDGMGVFPMMSQPAETYRAVTFCDTLRVSSPLPDVRDEACALKINSVGETLRYQILGKVPAGNTLIAHTRGICHFALPVDRAEGVIKTDSLPEGVLHLLLVDSIGQARSERLVFLRQPTEKWQVTPDKPAYGKRGKVRFNIALEREGQPLSGDFSVSVTDAGVVKTDSMAENIRSYLLLSSDLKGHIHNPGYYFLDDSPARQHYLDLVMMTHGWRRFKTDNLFTPRPFTPTHYGELGQYISGHIITPGGKDAKKATVTALAINQENVVGTAVSDSAGRFLVEGLDFQDSTVFFLSSKNKRGRIPFEVQVDKLYPQPKFNPLIPFLPEEQQQIRNDDLQRYLESFPPTDSKGLWEIDIEGVTVTAKNPDRQAIPLYTVMHDDTARFAKFGPMSLEQYVKHMPNVQSFGDGLSVRSRSRMYRVQIRVENIIIYSTSYLHRFTVSELKNIRFTIPVGSIPSFISNPKWPDYPCRMDIFLREDVNGDRNFVTYRTNGYAKNVEFYNPVYDTPEKFADKKPDNRTTLYWKPYQHIEDGKAQIEFYSNDTKKPQYEITIEGVTPQGIPCRYQQKL